MPLFVDSQSLPLGRVSDIAQDCMEIHQYDPPLLTSSVLSNSGVSSSLVPKSSLDLFSLYLAEYNPSNNLREKIAFRPDDTMNRLARCTADSAYWE